MNHDDHGNAQESLEDAIAVVGIAARFPGGYDANSIWQVLEAGECTATTFTREQLDPSLPVALTSSPNYVPVRGVLDDAECFDAAYFGFTPREAEILDPQQRVFLELAVHALEDAGYYRDTRAQSVGVYAGMSNVTYFRNHLQFRPDVLARVGDLNAMMANEKDYLATRVAHKLDLTGPCVNVSTACSTAAVAVAQACQALQSFQCDLALAGGISVTTPQNRGYVFQDGSILSPDGLCRPFDLRAQGTFFSNGGGIIVCKRLEDAVADGDTVHAIIRSAALNNDGARRASFAAPGVEGQAEVIAQALADADVSGGDIGYVEAHGTATPIGDPIEVSALKMAYRAHTSEREYCALGGIKGNIGHLDVAAGIAGIIKIILSMRHGKIPGTANFTSPNPELGIEDSPFYVHGETISWPERNGTRMAGVSAFGSGGTNAHLVLQQPPAAPEREPVQPRHETIYLSARSPGALARQVEALSSWCGADGKEQRLEDIAYSLRAGRPDEPHRLVAVARTTAELSATLARRANRVRSLAGSISAGVKREIGFVFPGQGAQYVGMGKELYEAEPVFRDALDRCFELFEAELDQPLKTIMFDASHESDTLINQTVFTQPAMFTLGYGLAKLLEDRGIGPAFMVGHSIGEYLSACLGGVFNLEDAVRAVSARGRLMQSMEPGAMASVAADVETLETLLGDGSVRVAAYNTPNVNVIAGSLEAMSEVEVALAAEGFEATRLRTSHAFHTEMMDGAAAELEAFVETLSLEAPKIPFVSTATGDWITEDEARSAAYWGGQIRNPVRFSQAVSTLLADRACTLLELGPRSTASAMVRAHIDDTSRAGVVPVLDTEKGALTETCAVLTAVASLWQFGHGRAESEEDAGHRISVPGYAFEKKRAWIEATSGLSSPKQASAAGVLDEESPDPAEPGGSSIEDRLKRLIEGAIGLDPSEINPDSEFVEMGFDSLMLTQLSVAIRGEFKVEVPFRKLQEALSTFEVLATHLEENAATPDAIREERVVSAEAAPAAVEESPEAAAEPAATGRGATIRRVASTLDERTLSAIRSIIDEYGARTSGSKAQTQDNRALLADPRTVAGFNPLWKEAVYPIVTNRSAGAYLWDIDGNRYVDFTCGFGPILLGHNPPFLKAALTEQLEAGVETGPQSNLAGEVAKLVVQATGVERVGFASTGTEAVIAATRLARTVTGRDKIVVFRGAYHGIHDEVTLSDRPAKTPLPGAPGIPRKSLGNVIHLDYDSPEALEVIRSHSSSIAAVLVEPVQSRRPSLQPRGFLRALRALTDELGIALVFDEIVTGFRVALGGAQAFFEVDADIVTYGKVVGGGYPIGIVAGKRKYLDALDGGSWQFGDDSVPEAGVTFFAGTFVRHPMMLAACAATLKHLIERGPSLQEALAERTTDLCRRLAKIADRHRVGLTIEHCSSWFTLDFEDRRHTALFFVLLRSQGMFMWEGRAFFLTDAHTESDLDALCQAFDSALARMVEEQLIEALPAKTLDRNELDASEPPIPGAKLGRDPDGVPGWYIEDEAQPGRYRLVTDEDLVGA